MNQHKTPITRKGDNSFLVVEQILPHMQLDDDVRQVIRHAYGYWPEGRGPSYEPICNGSSVVFDSGLFGRKMKDPYGVGHDWLCALHRWGMTDFNCQAWKRNEADAWYRRAKSQWGYPILAAIDRSGLFVGSWPAWCWGKNRLGDAEYRMQLRYSLSHHIAHSTIAIIPSSLGHA